MRKGVELRTIGDIAPYLSVVAQVIPVLALAFVLETRALARRYSRKSRGKDRGKRRILQIFFGFWMAATWAFLLAVFMWAIGGLTRDPEQALSGSDLQGLPLSVIAMVNGLIFVAFAPIAKIISLFISLTFAVIEDAYDSSRWSRRSRARKRGLSIRTVVVRKQREAIEARHRCLLAWSDASVQASIEERKVLRFDHARELREPLPSSDDLLERGVWLRSYRQLDERAATLSRAIAELNRFVEEGAALVGIIDHNTERLSSAAGSLDAYEKRLRKLLARSVPA